MERVWDFKGSVQFTLLFMGKGYGISDIPQPHNYPGTKLFCVNYDLKNHRIVCNEWKTKHLFWMEYSAVKKDSQTEIEAAMRSEGDVFKIYPRLNAQALSNS